MQENNVKKPSKFIRFVKNNLALLIIAMCIIAIVAIVIIASTRENEPVEQQNPIVDNNPPSEGNNPTQDNPPKEVKTYILPLEVYTIGMSFTDDEDNLFVFNQTLDIWQSHRAVDFLAESGSVVKAIASGTVSETGSTYGYGNYVKIDHGDGVIATYASLGNVLVKTGDEVAQGASIGEVSETASFEFADGAHLHFALEVNGEVTDPFTLLTQE